ncbi:MAG: ATP-binding cassette domain-containing protein [Nostoc sp.]|uniref:ATP-binding cassette domain-containing protein n=1 Tax=Nostoc sp. TaxID=1180 RepID=UPI002FFD2A82
MPNPNFTATNTLGKPFSTTTTNRRPFLEIKDVSKVYPTKKGPFTVLDGVNLNVEQGEFICVIGHSGCGKSMLLNMVSGLNFPTSGQVLLEGEPITKPGPDRMVVFQNYALLPWRTAFENIYLGFAEKVFSSGLRGRRQEAGGELQTTPKSLSSEKVIDFL